MINILIENTLLFEPFFQDHNWHVGCQACIQTMLMLPNYSFHTDNYMYYIELMVQGMGGLLSKQVLKPVIIFIKMQSFILCMHKVSIKFNFYIQNQSELHNLTLEVLFFRPEPQTVSHKPQSLHGDMWQSIGHASIHDSSSYSFPPHNLRKYFKISK